MPVGVRELVLHESEKVKRTLMDPSDFTNSCRKRLDKSGGTDFAP